MFPIGTILDNIRSWIIWPVFAGSAVIMFLYAGILFVTSAGDPSKITKAKTAVIWAVIGIAVGLLAYVAVGWIRFIVGV
jgi:hypothetical protein